MRPPVTVIDEDFAREYFPNEDPIGKRIHVSILNTEPEIIGIVGHVKHWGLDNRWRCPALDRGASVYSPDANPGSGWERTRTT